MPPKYLTLTFPSALRLHGQPRCSSRVISGAQRATKYSTAAWSQSQSPPETVSSKWLSRLSSGRTTAAAPPSAATVWLRIGTIFETSAIRSPGSLSAAAMAARRPAPPPPTTTTSNRTRCNAVNSHRDRDQLIQAAEKGPLAHRGESGAGRKPAGDLASPQVECERLERPEYSGHRPIERIERVRPMVVDDHHPAARLNDAQRLRECLAPDALGLLVQQEEQQRPVVAAGCELERRAVALYQLDGRLPGPVPPVPPQQAAGQLAGQVVELDAQHVHHVQLSTVCQPARDAARQVAVHAGDLQRPTLQVRAQRADRRVAQAVEVSPQDQVDQPLP